MKNSTITTELIISTEESYQPRYFQRTPVTRGIELQMAKTTRSKKAKGTRLEKEVAKIIEKVLEVEATRMVMSGAVDRFKGDIFTKLPVTFEVKNQEKLNFRKAFRQAEEANSPGKIPIMVTSRNNDSQILSMLDFNDLLTLMDYAIQGGWLDE